MSKINSELLNGVSLHNMVWEKRELEKIINDKKDEIEDNILNDTISILNKLIEENKIDDIPGLLNYFMRSIKEVERTL